MRASPNFSSRGEGAGQTAALDCAQRTPQLRSHPDARRLFYAAGRELSVFLRGRSVSAGRRLENGRTSAHPAQPAFELSWPDTRAAGVLSVSARGGRSWDSSGYKPLFLFE